jgi:hypothetical protein
MGRGDVSEDLIGHIAALVAQLPHGHLVVLGRPGDDRVGQHGQAPGLLALVGQVRLADGALLGVVQVTAERVQRLALVQLTGDLPPLRRIRQVLGGVDRPAQCSEKNRNRARPRGKLQQIR